MFSLFGCSFKSIDQNGNGEGSTEIDDAANKSYNDKNLNGTFEKVEKSSNEMGEKILETKKDEKTMKIQIQANGKDIIFQLNDSSAAKSLFEQLPMNIKVENYSNNEKIFYPKNKLDVSNTPLANAQTGTLAYYAPWGNVVMFYGDFGSASGLYEIGQVVSGCPDIVSISGTSKVDKY